MCVVSRATPRSLDRIDATSLRGYNTSAPRIPNHKSRSDAFRRPDPAGLEGGVLPTQRGDEQSGAMSESGRERGPALQNSDAVHTFMWRRVVRFNSRSALSSWATPCLLRTEKSQLEIRAEPLDIKEAWLHRRHLSHQSSWRRIRCPPKMSRRWPEP